MITIAYILICLPLVIIAFLLFAIFYYTLHTNSYWKKKKIPFVPAKPIVGNLLEALTFRKSVAETFDDIYHDKKTKETPFVGINIFNKPALVVRDLELIKRILIKDFSSFSDRRAASDFHSDKLGSSNLFFLKNPAWKILRARLTPFFSSGKMKKMWNLFNSIGNNLNDLMLSYKVNEKTRSFSTEFKEICAKFTSDVIASCAFGVEANSLKNPDDEFRKNGRKMLHFNWYRSIEFSSMFFLPEIVPYFKFKTFSKASSKFITTTIDYIIKEREESGVSRNDLIDTLINLKNEDISKDESATDIVFQGDVIAAQAAIFFAAGFEASSNIMSFALYELACQLNLQFKLRQEIKETLQKSNGELTYDNVQGMVYLNMIVQEILRMYPPLPYLDRICTNEEGYSLDPYDNFIIPKGMPIVIPIFSIHRDPMYWQNPNTFDPERFSAENKDSIVPYTHMPFGDGQHSCIGERFGILQVKVGLVNYFKNHYVTPFEETQRSMKLEPKALVLQAAGGITLKVTREPLF